MKEESSSNPDKASKKTEKRPENLFPEIPPEILENLPDETKAAFFQAVSFQGALPSPGLYAQYEETLPGSAERIMRLSELEQEQRHSWDNRALNHQNAEIKRGQWMGFTLGILTLSGGVFCAYIGEAWIAAIMVSATLASIIQMLTKNQAD